MVTQLVVMVVQTLLLWSLVFWLHRLKGRFTLVPLYCLVAVLAFLTHNLSDLGFSIIFQGWYFLVASFSFFTSLMLGILLLYLFEGPRATRIAIGVVLGVSLFYVLLVWVLGLQANTTSWVVLSSAKYKYYFWSIFAIVLDVFFISMFWELSGRLKRIPQFLQVFLVVFGTYTLDSAIFVTGYFGGQSIFWSVLTGNLITRFALALFITPVIDRHLRNEGFNEEKREKPKNFWEVLNFRSDLEVKIVSMESLQKELRDSEERYSLAIDGVSAGIWDWDIQEDKVTYSPKLYALLGYKYEDLGERFDDFKKMIHPEDVEEVNERISSSVESRSPLSVDCRLRLSDGEYRWFQCTGVTKYDVHSKPQRMVGSIIDIDEKRALLDSYQEKMAELEKMNKLMIDREIKMVELKEKIKNLEKI